MNINELTASTSPPTGPAGQAVQRKEGKKKKKEEESPRIVGAAGLVMLSSW
jgi:hypothetical protein